MLYREVQRPNQLFYIAIILIAGFFWWAVIQQVIYGRQFGDKPMPDVGLVLTWIFFGFLLPLVVFQVRLITEVRKEGLLIKFKPFNFGYREFNVQSIRDYKSVSFNSLKRFGGWGIRINLNGERIYNIAGNKGVELRLLSGDIVIIGSKKSDKLKKALDGAFLQ